MPKNIAKIKIIKIALLTLFSVITLSFPLNAQNQTVFLPEEITDDFLVPPKKHIQVTGQEFIQNLKNRTLPEEVNFFSENKFMWDNFFRNVTFDSMSVEISEESVIRDTTGYLAYWVSFHKDLDTDFDRDFSIYFQTKKLGDFLVPGSIKLGLPPKDVLLSLGGSQMYISEKYDFLMVGQIAFMMSKLFEEDSQNIVERFPEMSEKFRKEFTRHCKWGRRTSSVVEITRGKLNPSIYSVGVDDGFYLNLYFVTISLYNAKINDEEFEGVLRFTVRDIFRSNKIDFLEATGNVVQKEREY